MRNVLKLALLIAAITTSAACTDDPDAITADVLASDEPNDLVVDGELEPAEPAGIGGAEPIADRFEDTADRVESTRTGAVGHDEVTPDEMRRTAKLRLDWLRRARLTR